MDREYAREREGEGKQRRRWRGAAGNSQTQDHLA